MKYVVLILKLTSFPVISMAQLPEHVYAQSSPISLSTTAEIIIFIVIPALAVITWILFRRHRKITLRIDSCNNKTVHRKELKHLSANRNVEKNRTVLAREEMNEN